MPTSGPSSTEAVRVEYLYGIKAGQYDGNDDWQPAAVVRFRIIKKTKARIYYDADLLGHGLRLRCVDRQEIEATGEARPRSRQWWEPDSHLYAEAPAAVHHGTPDLPQLRAEMAAAHPDRGGTAEAFIAARARYQHARRTAGTQDSRPRSSTC
jgi:hypothetical protein